MSERRRSSASARAGGFFQPCGSERKSCRQSAPRASASARGRGRPTWAPTATRGGRERGMRARIAAPRMPECPSLHCLGMRKLVILGATGSIGEQALQVVSASDELAIAGLTAAQSWERLVEQARDHGVPVVALGDPEAAAKAARAWNGRVLSGEAGIRELIAGSDADLVLNGIVGSAGLGPTIVALTEGIDVALANKESLVVGGELVTALAEATDSRIIPVDSEHSALFQLIAAEHGRDAGSIERLVLTASGGPFRGRTRAELEEVTVEEALRHPTWEMG